MARRSAPATAPADTRLGLVMRSRFVAEPGEADASISLGRAWDEGVARGAWLAGVSPNGQVLGRDSLIGPHIAPRAASTSRRPFSATGEQAIRMLEFNNSAAPADPARETLAGYDGWAACVPAPAACERATEPLIENNTLPSHNHFRNAGPKQSKHMDDDSYDARQPESVAAVLKVFAIMQSLSERDETGISELSMRLATPKATVYRFLQTMKTLGYVRQHVDSERYGLSMKMFELGAKALQYPDLVEIAKPHMQQLSDATGETVHLGKLIDSEISYVHKVDSRHMLGIISRVGRRVPLHCTAIGKVLLAWEDPARRAVILGCTAFPLGAPGVARRKTPRQPHRSITGATP